LTQASFQCNILIYEYLFKYSVEPVGRRWDDKENYSS
jgi:hypothetical protein